MSKGDRVQEILDGDEGGAGFVDTNSPVWGHREVLKTEVHRLREELAGEKNRTRYRIDVLESGWKRYAHELAAREVEVYELRELLMREKDSE